MGSGAHLTGAFIPLKAVAAAAPRMLQEDWEMGLPSLKVQRFALA